MVLAPNKNARLGGEPFFDPPFLQFDLLPLLQTSLAFLLTPCFYLTPLSIGPTNRPEVPPVSFDQSDVPEQPASMCRPREEHASHCPKLTSSTRAGWQGRPLTQNARFFQGIFGKTWFSMVNTFF